MIFSVFSFISLFLSSESVESLVEESGCKVENAQAARLREAVGL